MSRGLRREDVVQDFYVCGRCGLKQFFIVGDEPPIPCVDCGYVHLDRPVDDVPSEIKLDLGRYS